MKCQILETRPQCGQAAAELGAQTIRNAIATQGQAWIIVATGASQFEMIQSLVAQPNIEWHKVTAFHLDEYVGLPIEHPASFRKYLWERFVSKLPFPLKAFHYLDGQTDAKSTIAQVNLAIRRCIIDLAFVGIGENGHLAFNDPPADFETDEPYLIVALDEACRMQQVGEEDGLIKQRVVFAVERGLSASAYVFRPQAPQGRLPAILACHGHGPFGKEPVMGNRSDPGLRANIDNSNYDYGLQLAKAGFVTIALDWRGFGERDDRRDPHFNDLTAGQDPCNVNFIRASLLGMTLLGMNVHDGQCALDYLVAQDFVDPQRIGVMGLSFGGTMATWMSIADSRVKAANIICYSDRFADFAIGRAYSCGSQITPGLFDLCDVPDLHGLIAPRPLLVEIGVHDRCFHVDSAMSCYREVEKIYQAVGAREKLELDFFEGGHRWGGNHSIRYFRDNL